MNPLGQLDLHGERVRGSHSVIRNILRSVAMVGPVLMASSKASRYRKIGPASAQTAGISGPRQAGRRPAYPKCGARERTARSGLRPEIRPETDGEDCGKTN
jgi:hypothetical protein